MAEVASAYDATSLDEASGEDGATRGDARNAALGFEDERFDLVEYGVILAPALGALPVRERLISRMRFDRDMTQGEIAEALGMSQMHVSRLLRRSLGRLREPAGGRSGAHYAEVALPPSPCGWHRT